METTIELKDLKISKFGSSYHIIIPQPLVKHGVLNEGLVSSVIIKKRNVVSRMPSRNLTTAQMSWRTALLADLHVDGDICEPARTHTVIGQYGSWVVAQ